MNKLCSTAIATAILFSVNAHAGSNKFEGLSIGIDTEFKSTTLEFSTAGYSYAGFGQQNTGLAVSADYGLAISDSAVVLIGAKLDLSDTTLIKIENNGLSATLKEKNHYSIFVAPGLKLNDATLGYLKLSYESAKGNVEANGASESETISGIGYGAGLRTQLNENWFASVEAMRVVYNAKSFGTVETKTGSTIASVGLTYKF